MDRPRRRGFSSTLQTCRTSSHPNHVLALVTTLGLVGALLSSGPAPATSPIRAERQAAASELQHRQDPQPIAGREGLRGTAGAERVGSTRYAVPADAVVVSGRGGSDAAAGTLRSPLRSIAAAISKAPSGATIVVRAGSYHETLTIPSSKRLTLQSYPGEAVWLEGSRRVKGFVRKGKVWVKSGWKVKFDSSPTYDRGAKDGTRKGWQWINPRFPMAAHPDQVWIGGRRLVQVGSRKAVRKGTFYVDYKADQLVLGSQPGKKEVRASALVTALTVLGAGSRVRGIGIQRYAPSVPDMGTLRLFAPRVSVSDVVVQKNATSGVTSYASNLTLRRVTSSENGLVGFHAHRSDSFTGSYLRAQGNNVERFNPTPAAAGYKMTASRGVDISHSTFTRNRATGFWLDESVYDATVVNNDMVGNARHGLVFELSAKLLAANNMVVGNKETGVLVLDAGEARLWNNTIKGSRLPFRVSDGPRFSRNDGRISFAARDIEIFNNVIGNVVRNDNWCGVICILDDRRQLTAEQMRVTLNGNLYLRKSASRPTYLVRWANGASGPVDYTTLARFRAREKQERAGAERIGAKTSPGAAGVRIPRQIARIIGLPVGTKHVGARRG